MNQEILDYFTNGKYLEAIDIANKHSIGPENDPYTSNIVSACLFRLGRYSEAYTLLEQLQSSLGDNYSYLSLFGAAARRLGYLEKSELLLSSALKINSDDAALRNNYANLLIDLGRLTESRSILEDLVGKYPEYEDARVNLNRLEFYEQQQSKNETLPDDITTIFSSVNQEQQSISGYSFSSFDPLAKAFAEEEVRLHGRIKMNVSGQEPTISDQLPTVDDKNIALEKLRLAEKAIKENNPDFALQLCSEVYSTNGGLPAVYDCVGDALVQKSMYREAELMYLQVSILDTPSLKHFINLTTLALMRGDTNLANIYLEKVSTMSPSHPSIGELKAKIQNSKSRYSFPS